MEERPLWTKYINCVMLPEAFIWIYARANKISYELATQEMRFGEYYDGCVPLMEALVQNKYFHYLCAFYQNATSRSKSYKLRTAN